MKFFKKLLIFLLCFSFLTGFSVPAFALSYEDVVDGLTNTFQGFIDPNEGLTSYRILYVPCGGRAESMGSAFTALANDISFLEYNPAASSVLETSQIGVFHNSWIANSAVETVAFSHRIKNLGFGAGLKCFYVDFVERDFFQDVAKSYYTETVGTLNLSYNFFSGYDFKGLALGLNLKAAFRGMPNYTDNDTSEIIPDSGLNQSGLALMGDIGALLRFNFLKFYSGREPNFQIGLTINNLGAGFTNFKSPEGVILDDPVPTKLAAGISYKPFRPVTLTFEFQQPVNLFDFSSSEKFSLGAGLNVQFTDFFAMQTGFLLRGGAPRFSLGSEFLVHNFLINMNYTLDLSSSVHPVNRISLSAKIDLGDSGRAILQSQVDVLYTKGLESYANGDMESAIGFWNSVLELNDSFDPAIKGIAAAETSLKLSDKINQANFFE